jgi:6-phosphogluconolactonase/glucosamine-6-phosphate isomerase/deaminase
MTCIFPLIGISGMTKKIVKNRIPVFSVNGATVPHVPQRMLVVVGVDPQKKTLKPQISMTILSIHPSKPILFSGFGKSKAAKRG